MKTISVLIAAAAVLSPVMLSTGIANAATFVAWEVANVAFGDTLNVRKYPSSGSQKQAAYPNGTVLSMTGRCTGNIDLKNIQKLPQQAQVSKVRFQWCEVWHDPAQNGNYVAGWVYGKYIVPG